MPKLTTPKSTRPRRASAPPPPVLSHDAIATRAFELYLARGGEHGSHLEDWLRAETELRVRRQS
jgi:hypothetical protein